MELEAAREFIRTNHCAVLVTRRRDGGLQSAPVTVGLDGEGLAIVSTRSDSAKARNLTRDPRAVLCVFTQAFYGPWVQVEGPVEIVRLPDSIEPLVDYFRRIAGEHPDWDEYRQAMRDQGRCLVRVAIERAAGMTG